MNINDEYQKAIDGQYDNDLLHVVADGKKVLEVLAPNYKDLFYAMASWNEIQIASLFDEKPFKKDNQECVYAGKVLLEYKNIYQKSELEQALRNVTFGAKIDECKIYLTTNYVNSINTLESMLSKNIYLTFCSLFYRDKNNNLVKSPLFFLRGKLRKNENGFFIKCTSDGPIFNEALARFIQDEHSIDITYNKVVFDYYDYITFVSHKVANLLWAIEESTYIITTNVIKSNALARISNLGNTILSYKTIRNLKEEPNKIEDNLPLVSKLQEELQKNSVLNLKINDEKLKTKAFTEVLTKAIKNEKSILVIGDKTLFDETVEKLKLRPFVNPYSTLNNKLSLFDAFNEIEKDNFTLNYDGTRFLELSKIQKDFYMMEEEKTMISIPTGETIVEAIQSIMKHDKNLVSPLDINIAADYSYDDFLEDRECLETINNSKSIKDTVLADHPFYGLETENSKENFDKLKALLQKIDENIEDFFNSAKDLCESSNGFIKIEKPRDFDEYENHFELFCRYNGFPLIYFNYDNDEKLVELLSAIKSGFKSISSLKLSIENMTSNSFFLDDWETLLEKEKSKDRKAKKELKVKLKTKTHANLKSLILLLDSYKTNLQKVDSYINFVEENYQIKIKSIDDIIYCENALSYVDDFIRQVKLYDSINFNSDFVKKVMTDGDYRKQLNDIILPSIQQKRFELDTLFDEYKEFNPHDYNDYSDFTYDELKMSFKAKINASYEEFEEYCNLSQKLKDASHHLKDYINEYSDLNQPLTNFTNDFMFSLYEAFYTNYESLYGGSEAWIENEEKYISILKEYESLYYINEIKSIEQLQQAKCEKDELNRTKDELRKLTKTSRVYNTAYIYPRYQKKLVYYYPIDYVSNDDVYAYANAKYDIVIILDLESLNVIQLFNALMLGNSAVIFEKEETLKKCYEINYSNLLEKRYWKKVEPVLKDLVKDIKIDYDIKLNYEYKNDVFPIALIRPGTEKPSFILIPDLVYLLNNDCLWTYCNLMPRIINDTLEITPIIINTLEIALADDKNLYLRQVINGLLEQKRLEKENKEVKKTKEHLATPSKEKYLERLTDIYNNFSDYPSEFEIKELLNNHEYETLLKKIVPFNSNKIMLYGKEFYDYVIDQKNLGKIKLTSDKFYYIPGERIEVKKSLHSQRPIEDVSIEEMVRAIYTYLLNFSFVRIDVLLNELMHVFASSTSDPIFNETYTKAINYLLNKGYILKEYNKIRLV